MALVIIISSAMVKLCGVNNVFSGCFVAGIVRRRSVAATAKECQGQSAYVLMCARRSCDSASAAVQCEAMPQNISRNNGKDEGIPGAVENAPFVLVPPGDVTLAGRHLLSNRGIPLNLDWVRQVRVNTSAVERRAQSHVARRAVKKDWQAAWLLRAITCMDLTTLSGDDTDDRVRRLCAKARQPIQNDLVRKLGIEGLDVKVAAVCVYHTFIETALHALEGSGVHVAAVSTGFPAGLSPLAERVAEIRRSVEAGAHEIDVVITRGYVFGGRWQALYDEIAAFKQACGAAHMKVILAAGDLLTFRK